MGNISRLLRRTTGILAIIGAHIAQHQRLTYIPIDAVGVGGAYGINDAGQIVGKVGHGPSPDSHGFLLDGDTLTFIDVPGAGKGSTS